MPSSSTMRSAGVLALLAIVALACLAATASAQPCIKCEVSRFASCRANQAALDEICTTRIQLLLLTPLSTGLPWQLQLSQPVQARLPQDCRHREVQARGTGGRPQGCSRVLRAHGGT